MSSTTISIEEFMPGFLDSLTKEEKILVLFGIAFGIVLVGVAIGGLICIYTGTRKFQSQYYYHDEGNFQAKGLEENYNFYDRSVVAFGLANAIRARQLRGFSHLPRSISESYPSTNDPMTSPYKYKRKIGRKRRSRKRFKIVRGRAGNTAKPIRSDVEQIGAAYSVPVYGRPYLMSNTGSSYVPKATRSSLLYVTE